VQFRNGSMDEYIWKEQRAAYRLLNIEDGSVVLDIGGHAGFFALYALARGASRVVSFEPSKANYAQGRLNTAMKPVEWFNEAVASEGGIGVLYLNTGKNSGAHSLEIQRGRSATPVKKVAFRHIVGIAPFQAVKIDIEGGEYDLDMGLLPDTCKALAMELHLNRREWRYDKAPRMVEAIRLQGFKPIKEPNIGQKNWHTVGIWKR
jgi:FkbM family methyltransferase